MTAMTPLLANERTAAQLLDMKSAAFRRLVNEGILPGPVNIGGFERWDVEQLRVVASGAIAEGEGTIEW